MRVLRDNRDSVMAMLEAFVYDPLISWRLLTRRENETALDSSVPLSRGVGKLLYSLWYNKRLILNTDYRVQQELKNTTERDYVNLNEIDIHLSLNWLLRNFCFSLRSYRPHFISDLLSRRSCLHAFILPITPELSSPPFFPPPLLSSLCFFFTQSTFSPYFVYPQKKSGHIFSHHNYSHYNHSHHNHSQYDFFF